jgi:TolB-like protein/Flp pilus assembly protein TadD
VDVLTDTRTDFWSTLRRRKVIQWGLAYVAGAWGFLEGLGYLADLFQWPEPVQKVALIVLAMALPAVLVIAWYHGDRGNQRVTTRELGIVAGLLLLTGAIAWTYWRQAGPTDVADTVDTTGAIAPRAIATSDIRPAIAVLPFENRSDDPGDAHFVDGIHDDVLTQLARVSSIRVISRTSVEQFRGTRQPLREIASQLGVSQVLEGGVQRAGDRVRINVQLIDATSDTHVWAETYDRQATISDLFAIQTDIATSIAAALKASLSTHDRANLSTLPTHSLEAWYDYQLARQRMAGRTLEGLNDAERLFTQAIERDPQFAMAHAALGATRVLQGYYAPQTWQVESAESSVRAALEIDPNLGEAWATLGLLAIAQDDPALALTRLDRAVQLAPNFSSGRQWRSAALTRLGRRAEAVAEAERALALSPLEPVLNLNLANTLGAAERFDSAADFARRAAALDPSSGAAYAVLAEIEAHGRGRFVEAVHVLERGLEAEPNNPFLLAQLARVYLSLGEPDSARHWLEEGLDRAPGAPMLLAMGAMLEFAQGDPKRGLEFARRAATADHRAQALLADYYLREGNAKAVRQLYEKTRPALFDHEPRVDGTNYGQAIGLAMALRRLNEKGRASLLLDRAEQALGGLSRLGDSGYAVADVSIQALRGDSTRALATLRAAERQGWRADWRYSRDLDPGLASIRDTPEFKAVFADIEADMARQREELRRAR